jgi:hypothetical protein
MGARNPEAEHKAIGLDRARFDGAQRERDERREDSSAG